MLAKDSLRQPNGLYLLFFTEMWERFGFYTLQTIIILYMSKSLLYVYGDGRSYAVYAAFSGLLYLMPVLGGYLADRYFGFQYAIIIGGIIFILSYILTALSGSHAFFLGLSVLVCAHGLFKPNVSSLLGELYAEHDPRREGGFTLFYMGINIGSLFPPLVAGFVVHLWGWHAGFLLAAVGMLFGMIIFLSGRRLLNGAGMLPLHSPLQRSGGFRVAFGLIFFLGLIVTIAIVYLAFGYPVVTGRVLEVCSVLVVLVVVGVALRESRLVRNKLLAALTLIAISVGFWALYNQTFTSLMLFADRNMVKSFCGIPLSTENTQFFNPFFIVVLSPILSRIWTSLSKRSINPSYPGKFTLGVVMVGLGFFVLSFGIKYFSENGLVSANWLVSSYFLQTLGELFLSPIALAMVTELAPKHLVGMMMGVWFFSNSIAAVFGGSLARLTDIPAGTSVVAALGIYQHGFLMFSVLALMLAIVSLLLMPIVKRLIRD